MFKLFGKSIDISQEKYKLAILLTLFGVALFFLTNKYWISPDEYLYVDLGRSFSAGYSGVECLHCIDTAHTPLLPFLISLGYYFFHIDSIVFYRLISTIFALAAIYIFYKIARVAFEKKKEAYLALFGILLFPGFITFSNKVGPDILALFFTAIVLYLLLKREKYWKISIALLLVFLSKDYTAIFPSVVIFFVIFFDAFKEKNESYLRKIKSVIFNNMIVFAPLLLAILLFVATSLLPYPRMLENLLLEVFGGGYFYVAAKIQNLFHITGGGYALDGRNIFSSIIQLNVADIFRGATFFEKIKLIYLSSYQEGDVNILAVPLLIVGLVLRMKALYASFKNNYNLVRKDLIFILFLLVVFYFNYRVADGEHGFRIIFPLMISFLYFIYWAWKELFEKRNYWVKFSFGALAFLFIYFYFQSNKGDIAYNSVISKEGLIAIFLKYKLYFNILLYAFFAGFILLCNKIKFKLKHMFLLGLLIFTCVYKVLPFALDKYLADRSYGNDYNLILARPYLENIEKKDSIVLTNAKPYAYYYYANSTQLPNVDKPSLPIIRKKPEVIYPNRLISTDHLKENVEINFICQNGIDYVFYVHTDDDKNILNGYINSLPYLMPIKEYFLPENNRFNWGLYEMNKNFCNK